MISKAFMLKLLPSLFGHAAPMRFLEGGLAVADQCGPKAVTSRDQASNYFEGLQAKNHRFSCTSTNCQGSSPVGLFV